MDTSTHAYPASDLAAFFAAYLDGPHPAQETREAELVVDLADYDVCAVARD
jgi:hypothetical protein